MQHRAFISRSALLGLIVTLLVFSFLIFRIPGLARWLRQDFFFQNNNYQLIADGPGVVPGNAKDCGREDRNVVGEGYNPVMRACFDDAWQQCTSAYFMHQAITEEGDPITTTAIIEKNNGGTCSIKVHYESEDRFGWKGTQTSICSEVLQIEQKCDNRVRQCKDILVITTCGGTSFYEYQI